MNKKVKNLADIKIEPLSEFIENNLTPSCDSRLSVSKASVSPAVVPSQPKTEKRKHK